MRTRYQKLEHEALFLSIDGVGPIRVEKILSLGTPEEFVDVIQEDESPICGLAKCMFDIVGDPKKYLPLCKEYIAYKKDPQHVHNKASEIIHTRLYDEILKTQTDVSEDLAKTPKVFEQLWDTVDDSDKFQEVLAKYLVPYGYEETIYDVSAFLKKYYQPIVVFEVQNDFYDYREYLNGELKSIEKSKSSSKYLCDLGKMVVHVKDLIKLSESLCEDSNIQSDLVDVCDMDIYGKPKFKIIENFINSMRPDKKPKRLTKDIKYLKLIKMHVEPNTDRGSNEYQLAIPRKYTVSFDYKYEDFEKQLDKNKLMDLCCVNHPSQYDIMKRLYPEMRDTFVECMTLFEEIFQYNLATKQGDVYIPDVKLKSSGREHDALVSILRNKAEDVRIMLKVNEINKLMTTVLDTLCKLEADYYDRPAKKLNQKYMSNLYLLTYVSTQAQINLKNIMLRFNDESVTNLSEKYTTMYKVYRPFLTINKMEGGFNLSKAEDLDDVITMLQVANSNAIEMCK